MQQHDGEYNPKEKVMKLIDPIVAKILRLKPGDSFKPFGGDLYFNINDAMKRDGGSVYVVHQSIVCQVPWDNNEITGTVYMANTRTHILLSQLVVVNGVVKAVQKVKTGKGVIDISADGDRWEGEVDLLTNTICGWGKVYDKDNVLSYCGFRVGAENVVYGTFYHGGIEVPYYEGTHASGFFMGHGKMFDRNNRLVQEGVFIHSRRPELSVHLNAFNCSLLTSELEEVELEDSCTFTSLQCDWSLFKRLRVFSAKNRCFLCSTSLQFTDLPVLETITLGDLVSYAFEDEIQDENAEMEMEEVEAAKVRSLVVSNCPRLCALLIGARAMQFYSSFSVKRCDALLAITVGNDNFPYISSVEFKSARGAGA